MIMRRWHRWAAIPAALFLFFIALTGVLLHLDMIRLGQHPPGHEPKREEVIQPIPSNATLAVMIGRIGDAARNQHTIPVRMIQLTFVGSRVTLIAGPGGPPGNPQIKLDGVTGRPVSDPIAPRDYHYLLQDIHAGYLFGWTGRIVSIVSGISLMILAVSGVQVWWDLRQRRRDQRIWWK